MRLLVRQVTSLRVVKLVKQLQLASTISHTEIQFCLARSSGPDINDILDIFKEEGFLALAER